VVTSDLSVAGVIFLAVTLYRLAIWATRA
jgi:hypothetical protein